MQRDALGVLRKARHRTAQIQLRRTLLLKGRQQQAVQVGAVNRGIGRAVALLHRGPELQYTEFGARDRAAHLQSFRKRSDLGHGVLQAPAMEQLDHIGPHLDAGPDLGEFGRALKQRQLSTCARAGQRRRQATDPPTHNQNFAHACILAITLHIYPYCAYSPAT